MNFEKAAQHWQDLVDLPEMGCGKSAFGEGRHGKNVDLAIRKSERHSRVIGRAFFVKLAHDGIIELDIVALKASPDAPRALDYRREGAIGELRLKKDIVGLREHLHLTRIVAPNEYGGKNLRMQGRNDDRHTGNGITVVLEENRRTVQPIRPP